MGLPSRGAASLAAARSQAAPARRIGAPIGSPAGSQAAQPGISDGVDRQVRGRVLRYSLFWTRLAPANQGVSPGDLAVSKKHDRGYVESKPVQGGIIEGVLR
ncbi:MAG: hypothetical protein E5X40_24145 [Mesorhizobium sp.]|nr:MAG: hypothetical protein E5X40_24145 [Mesorhizobium sp.]